MAITPEFVQEFRIEEYKALRSEILYQIQDIDQIKFWIAAAMAAYYSFIAAKLVSVHDGRLVLIGPVWIWGAPILLPAIGYLRLLAHMHQLGLFAEYIKKIEELYPGLPGWEHFYGEHRAEDYVWNYDEFYFLILLLFSCAVLAIRWRTGRLHRRTRPR
jgi:hypothetical protein